jgi:hypothetical protein
MIEYSLIHIPQLGKELTDEALMLAEAGKSKSI